MEVALINKKNQRWIFLGLILFYFSIGAITLLLSERKLISILDTLPVTCPLRKFTGFLCSFCGMTHAWVYFWHGDFAKSKLANFLSLPLFIGAPLFLASLTFSKFWNEKRARFGAIVGISILVVYTIARNIRF
jgi:hypothetical protein